MLVIRLVGGGPSRYELGRGGRKLGMNARVVVRDLVVVPHDGERELGMGGLEVRVELVQRVTETIGPEVHRLRLETRRRRDAA